MHCPVIYRYGGVEELSFLGPRVAGSEVEGRIMEFTRHHGGAFLQPNGNLRRTGGPLWLGLRRDQRGEEQ